MKSRRTWWLIFAICAAAAGAALLWITVEMVRLERAELTARAEADHQESLRLALWRMDSFFAPRLAREAARPYFQYLPYYPQGRAYTRLLSAIEPGEILTPSPLLTFQSEFFLLHFQLDEDGALTSPQVPEGNLRDLAEATLLTSEQIASRAALLADLRPRLAAGAELAAAIARAGERTIEIMEEPPPAILPPPDAPPQQVAVAQKGQSARSQAEASGRARSFNYAQNIAPDAQQRMIGPAGPEGEPAEVAVGPLTPVWLNQTEGKGGRRTMVLARELRVGDAAYFQGVLVDWLALRASLLAEIDDLFADAELLIIDGDVDAADVETEALASIPVALEVGEPAPVTTASLFTPARGTIALSWAAMIVAVGAIAIMLRASIAWGEKRSRFASAVTHELRTPLTTFRMYSEMLAEGMVRDEDQRRTYLATLKDESNRLATLVENVLAYARLERGAARVERQHTTLGALFDRLLPTLQRRADGAQMELVPDLASSADTPLHIDVEAVGQILFNLVDNACKYAADAEDRRIELAAAVANGRLVIAVRDHGPGVDPALVREIFAPFERGSRRPGDATPGVGLGLALARGLARHLGGDLRLAACAGAGACFRLSLPAAS